MVLSSIQVTDDEDADASPETFDGWVFGLASKTIVAMGDYETPSSLWKPILSLGKQAHDWNREILLGLVLRWLPGGSRYRNVSRTMVRDDRIRALFARMGPRTGWNIRA